MPDDRFDERLKRDLERPRLAAPSPAQARYRRVQAAGALVGWFRLGGAFAAGAVAAALVLTVGTGSPNPRVWTVRVASAFTQITEPVLAPPAPSPSPSPSASATPSASPWEETSTTPSDQETGGVPEPSRSPEASGDGGDRQPTPEPSDSPTAGPTPGPSSTPSPDGGGDGGDGDMQATPSPTISPLPSPSSDH